MMAQKTRCVEGCAEHLRRRTAVALWVAQLGVKARNVKLHKAVRRTSALSEKVRFWVNDGCMGTSVVGHFHIRSPRRLGQAEEAE